MGNWSKLKADEKIRVIKFARQNGVSDINTIRDTYNLYSSGGQEEILNKVNSSNANFVQRLKDPNRKNIPDWESPVDRISTHKLSVGTDENGNHYIFPEVQEINGELIDFTRPPYHRFAGEISAEMRGDTVRVHSLEDAIKFTETYKQYYPFNRGGNLVHKYDGEQVGQNQELNSNYIIPTVNQDLLDPTKQIIHDFSKANQYDFTPMQQQYTNDYINQMQTANQKVILDALQSDKRLLKSYNKSNIQGDAASFNSWVYSLKPSKRRRLENTIGFPRKQSVTTVGQYGIISPSSLLGLKDVGDTYNPALFDQNYVYKVESHNKKGRSELDKYVYNQTYQHILNLLQPQLQDKYNAENNPYVTYLQSYFDSDVYKQRAANNNVLPTTFIYNPFINTSKSHNAIGDSNAIITLGTQYYTPEVFNNVAAHELGHSAFYGYANNTQIDPYAINLLTNSLPAGVTYNNDHDSSFNENYADLLNTRASLYNNNIYDSTTGGVFTQEMLDAYRQTEDGKNNRFLKYHTDQAIIDAINNIAYNTTNPFEVSNGAYLAAFGGQLNSKKSTGGPLYPFSFEKNPFLKTPVVRYDEGGQTYTVKKGDTFSQIAQNVGVSVQDLQKLNPTITNVNRIREGQNINIPAYMFSEIFNTPQFTGLSIPQVQRTQPLQQQNTPIQSVAVPTQKGLKTAGPLDLQELAVRQAYTESRLRPDIVNSKGAYGLFQIMQPALDDYNRVNKTNYTLEDMKNADNNIKVRNWYMNYLSNLGFINKGDIQSDSVEMYKVLASFNAGAGNVKNALTKAKADGKDIYDSWDWVSYLWDEPREYADFILRGIETKGTNKNDSVYKAVSTAKSGTANKIRNSIKQ